MNFAPGGHWLYAMLSPENQKHWGRMNYYTINHHKNYDMEDVFCDENGVVNSDLPGSKGKTVFTETAKGTKVEFQTIYQTEADLQKIVEMGFEQGISACFEQLDSLFKANKI
ncbi:MAG: SRPBCC domain-containing protein [Flavisolibacter sp.]|jgi:uncharacterized protein YndB with AHSA1/START domain|nr:SRPBCC domain-containing protein [Flavisolibacter sp.]